VVSHNGGRGHQHQFTVVGGSGSGSGHQHRHVGILRSSTLVAVGCHCLQAVVEAVVAMIGGKGGGGGSWAVMVELACRRHLALVVLALLAGLSFIQMSGSALACVGFGEIRR